MEGGALYSGDFRVEEVRRGGFRMFYLFVRVWLARLRMRHRMAVRCVDRSWRPLEISWRRVRMN